MVGGEPDVPFFILLYASDKILSYCCRKFQILNTVIRINSNNIACRRTKPNISTRVGLGAEKCFIPYKIVMGVVNNFRMVVSYNSVDQTKPQLTVLILSYAICFG